MKPRGFRDGDVVLWEQEDKGITQTLWTSLEIETPVFRISQRWDDGEEATVYLYLKELKEMAQAARDHTFPRGDVQQWEEYLDAQDRHDDATV